MAELSESENTLAYRIMVLITKLRSFIKKTQEKQIGYFSYDSSFKSDKII